MVKNNLSINSNKILPIIKKWLYSDKDIFIRELISNATDAIEKLKILTSQNIAPQNKNEFQINVTLDKENKTISIKDNGIGMTKEEVEKYISEIAFSGAEEFLEKYKSNNEKDQIIGHFGLGFYSSFMIAKKVTIETKSYKENSKPVLWSCDGSSEYEISEIDSNKEIGTTIVLHIAEEEEEFLDETKINQIVKKYCPFLPYPIYINENNINNKNPLWLKAPSECSDKEYIDFYKELYPFEPDPIFWVHLNVEFPFHLKGILYFPKIGSNFDINKNGIKLFCNRVFVSDNCKDILSDFLSVLKGAIDSPDIPLNVSRSYLQMDATVRKLSTHITKKISDKLNKLFKTSKEKYLSFYPDIETIVKLGILQDDAFYDKIKSCLIWKDLESNWLTIDEYLENNKEKNENKIFYTHEESINFIKLYKEKNISILLANSPIDTAIINFLEVKLKDVKFKRIDGDIDDVIIDKEKEKSLLDSNGKSIASNIASFIKKAIGIDDIEVEAKSLASDTIPGFIMLKEEERRFRDYLKLTKGGDMDMPTKHTFVVNTNNSIINKIVKMKDQNIAKDIVKQIYNLSLLSQKELPPESISSFIEHSNKVLESLLKQPQ